MASWTSACTSPGATVGSIEGSGSVFLGAKNLTVGNGMNSSFSGVLQDGGSSAGTGGSLTVAGNGWLTLSGINTYTGPTLVEPGTLLARCRQRRRHSSPISNHRAHWASRRTLCKPCPNPAQRCHSWPGWVFFSACRASVAASGCKRPIAAPWLAV